MVTWLLNPDVEASSHILESLDKSHALLAASSAHCISTQNHQFGHEYGSTVLFSDKYGQKMSAAIPHIWASIFTSMTWFGSHSAKTNTDDLKFSYHHHLDTWLTSYQSPSLQNLFYNEASCNVYTHLLETEKQSSYLNIHFTRARHEDCLGRLRNYLARWLPREALFEQWSPMQNEASNDVYGLTGSSWRIISRISWRCLASWNSKQMTSSETAKQA